MALGDTALRELVLRLCAAELSRAGRGLDGITAGGDQNAADGGLDVHVDGSEAALPFLPAFPVGFQVKAEAMGRAKIRDEMRPNGNLRQMILELAAREGTYVIACGKQTSSESRLRERRAAMRAAVSDLPEGANLRLEYYDADQLARWAGDHPGVALWLSEQAGLDTAGWHAHGRWSGHVGGDAPFFADEAARAQIDRANDLVRLDEALHRVGAQLNEPRAVVRLVGLSGMGKTRFAQALFESVGDVGAPLASSLAVYCDAAGDLGVSPEGLMTRLEAAGQRAVVIVDNCRSDLHRRLATLATRLSSRLSLLTIDFDVAPDQPADTTVVRLEPAGDDLIDRLLAARAPNITRADRQRVVAFAGGNTRIALSLASAPAGQGLADLQDRELLDRLFLTYRRQDDFELRRVARATALVGAFDIAASGEAAEVSILARLANVDEFTFHEKVVELLERGLMQQRGDQRALLPQALAVRLADELFQSQPFLIAPTLLEDAPSRLKRSFLRRLGLLHETPQAVALGERLLAADGGYAVKVLGGREDWSIFAQLAPLAPQRALEILAAAVRDADIEDETFRWSVRTDALRLLAALTHAPDTFEGATRVTAEILARLTADPRDRGNRDNFLKLFQSARSGTQASLEARFRLLEELLRHEDARFVTLAVDALGSALSVKLEGPQLAPLFGSRPLGPSWSPSDDAGWHAWYDRGISLAITLIQDPSFCGAVRPLLARRLGEMLRIDLLRELARETIVFLADGRFWRDGWFAVCRLLNRYRHPQSQPPASLVGFERTLRPRTFEDRFSAWGQGDPSAWTSPVATGHGQHQRYLRHARRLGRDLAADLGAARPILAEAIRTRGTGVIAVGGGIASALGDLDGGWHLLRDLANGDAPLKEGSLLIGYVDDAAKRAPKTVARWLAELSDAPDLRRFTVDLNLAAGLPGDVEAQRMLVALRSGWVSPRDFEALRYGRRTHGISSPLLAEILQDLARTPEGLQVAIEVFAMRSLGTSASSLDEILLSAGRALLIALATAPATITGNGEVGFIAEACLPGSDGEPAAAALAAALVRPGTAGRAIREDEQLASILFKHHPRTTLNAAFGDHIDLSDLRHEMIFHGLDDDDEPEPGPLGQAPDAVLKAWVEASPETRAPRVARFVRYFRRDGTDLHWTPIALWLVESSGQERGVAEVFSDRLWSGSWSGSTADHYERRQKLVEALLGHPNAEIASWAGEFSVRLRRFVADARAQERTPERFE